MKRLLRSQRGGVALIIVLAFMTLGMPVVTSTLNLADAFAVDSGVKNDVLKRQYCGLAVREYILYLLLDQSVGGRWEAVVADPPTGAGGLGSITCNSKEINFTVTVPSQPPGTPPTVALPDFLVTKTVTSPTPVPPATVPVISPNDPVTYTITVKNQGNNPATLTRVFDKLPSGFGYLGPTTGAASLDPCLFKEEDLELGSIGDLHCSVGSNDELDIEGQSVISGDITVVGGEIDIEEGATVFGVVRASGQVELQESRVGAVISWGGGVEIEDGTTVEGRVWGAGDVEIGDAGSEEFVSVEGDVTSSGGEVKIEDGAVVLGNVWAQGNVVIEDGARIGSSACVSGGDVTSITGNVTVDDDSVVCGDIWAGNNVVIDDDAQVKGSIYAAGDVTLEDGAIVTGQVVAGGQIILEGSAQILGQGAAPSSATPTIPLTESADLRGQVLLNWEIDPPVTLQPAGELSLTFVAKAGPDTGNFCNQAWVEPGGIATSTGLTGQVQVGSQTGQCQPPNYLVTQTVTPSILAANDDAPADFTYTITIDNTGGTDTLTLNKIQNLLPEGLEYAGFSVTVPPSWQAQTTIPPSATFLQRQLVTWKFDSPLLIPAGQVETLDFSVEVTAPPLLVGDNYWSEVWLTFDELLQRVETGPSAVVRVLTVFDGTATDGGTDLSSFQLWLGDDVSTIRWTIN